RVMPPWRLWGESRMDNLGNRSPAWLCRAGFRAGGMVAVGVAAVLLTDRLAGRHLLMWPLWVGAAVGGRTGDIQRGRVGRESRAACSATRMLAGSRQVDGRSLRVIKMALLVLSDKENIACYCESGWAGCPG